MTSSAFIDAAQGMSHCCFRFSAEPITMDDGLRHPRTALGS